MRPLLLLSLLSFLLAAPAARADDGYDDGYDLWLRYDRVEDAALADHYRAVLAHLVVPGEGATLDAVRAELRRGLEGLLGAAPTITTDRFADLPADGALLVWTPRRDGAYVPEDHAGGPFAGLGDEGYTLRSRVEDGGRRTVLMANTPVGLLYGTFHLLRLMQTGERLDDLDVTEAPAVGLRLLNHWDNLDRTVERGYAGASLWDWHRLPGPWPGVIDPRYTDYARANASVGINATVLTNVNANALVLTPMYLEKAAALADVFRPYGIRVLLTARFSAPIEIGGLPTADPLDPDVRAWWASKATEIYRHIPDFGGFLVKANSEGQPGPQDYDRSHADGANMLADAVAPFGGVVMWRAFVYSADDPDDRAKQAYDEFVPLDGTFRDNVLVQVKNGPIDFQPREPFHPLFGAMPETPLAMEFQITKEYLGFSTHLAYLGPMWEEVLREDTHVQGRGSTVADVIDGSLHGYRHTAVAGVANIGTDRNWSGSHFDQANWYAFGRLAWDPRAGASEIAREWIRMTFMNDPAFVEPVHAMMMDSREAVVDYMTPLGLHHLMATGHHYGPGPWVGDLSRPEWNPVYYHRADTVGIGFDRTATGSNAVAQYAPAVAARYGDPESVPEPLLLWFHRVQWDHEMPSGRTLWDELVHRYHRGVDRVRAMRETWDKLAWYMDPERHAQIRAYLAVQEAEAVWWRDASLAYFQTFSRRPIPAGYDKPAHPLEYYRGLSFPLAPGN